MARYSISTPKKKNPLDNLPTYTRKKCQEEVEEGAFIFSFKHLDKTQGDSFEKWQNDKILARAMSKLENYCNDKLITQQSKKFKPYSSYPTKSRYKKPLHTPEDAQWASLHVTGKQCFGGHIVGSTFYIVFLDGGHGFWWTDIQDR